MGIYREKKEQFIENIEFYKKRIADDEDDNISFCDNSDNDVT